jgi:hypothetical protein
LSFQKINYCVDDNNVHLLLPLDDLPHLLPLLGQVGPALLRRGEDLGPGLELGQEGVHGRQGGDGHVWNLLSDVLFGRDAKILLSCSCSCSCSGGGGGKIQSERSPPARRRLE